MMLVTEAVNSHMTHIEDLVLHKGTQGVHTVFNMIDSIRDTLAGHTKARHTMSVKFDGSPAIFAGRDPRDGRFFVATKGIFSKTPTIYKTPQEIAARVEGDLAHKLKVALETFPHLGIKGIVQGDLLYTRDTLERKTINGEKYIVFHPNTIVYCVPAASELGQTILRSKIGVVWHTTYKGRSFDTLRAQFNKVIAANMRKTKDVWAVDATVKDLSGVVSLTTSETAHLDHLISVAKERFEEIDHSALNSIHKNEAVMARIEVFNNSKVRNGEVQIGDPVDHVRAMMKAVDDYYVKEIEGKKTEKGQAVWKDRRREAIAFFTQHPIRELAKVFQLMKDIIEIKHFLIKKLNGINGLKTFLLSKKGFEVTDQEGFVIADHIGNAVKLVDRLTFSYANFSQDIMRGWNK